MAADEFSRRIHDNIHAMVKGPEQIGCYGIVEDKGILLLMGDFGKGFEVGHVVLGVADRLGIDGFCFGGNGLLMASRSSEGTKCTFWPCGEKYSGRNYRCRRKGYPRRQFRRPPGRYLTTQEWWPIDRWLPPRRLPPLNGRDSLSKTSVVGFIKPV